MTFDIVAILPDRRVEFSTDHNPHESSMWYCSQCGDFYARIIAYEKDSAKPLRHQAHTGCCKNCKPIWKELPGQISYSLFEPWWPLELLSYVVDCELSIAYSLPNLELKEIPNASTA